jgi:cytochrome P450
LTNTRRAIEESLRLYPPAWGFSRRAVGDDEIGGYSLRKGWLVFVIPFVVHRRAALWPDPDRFDPERFTPEREANGRDSRTSRSAGGRAGASDISSRWSRRS